MSKQVYASIAHGFTRTKPPCFRCGTCCQRIPIEISAEERDRIALHLKSKEKRLFFASITTDFEEANVLPDQGWNTLTFGVGWLRAPCMFIDWEKRKGRVRADCRIYKIRPDMCRKFYCGRQSEDEIFSPLNFTYRCESEENFISKRLLGKRKELMLE